MPEGQMPQTTKQHPVPQNIMEVEFKLIGDLTIRQFGFVAIGGVVAFLAFKSGLPAIFRWPLTVGSVALGLGMAFLPIQDRGLDKWIINFFNSIYSPTQRVWRKEPPPPAYLLSDYEQMVKSEIISLAPVKSRRKLQEFLKTLPEEEEKTKLDTEEENFLNRLDFSVSLPESLRQEAVPLEVEVEEAPEAEAPLPTEEEIPPTPPEEITAKLPQVPPIKPRKPPPKIKPVVSIAPKRVSVPKKLKLASEINFSEQPVFTIVTPEAKREFVPAIRTVRPGRRLTTLPSLEGEIVLPVKGEKVIPSFEEVEQKRKEALEKVERKEATRGTSLLDELKIATEVAKKELKEAPPGRREVVKEELPPEKERERLESQVKMLTSRVEKLQKQAEKKTDAADIEKTISYYQKQINQLQQQLESLTASQAEEQKLGIPPDYQKELEKTRKEAEETLSAIRKAKKEIEKLRRKIEEEPEKREIFEKELEEQKGKVEKLEEKRALNMDTITRLLRQLRKARRVEEMVVIKEKRTEEKKEEEVPSDAVPNIISGVVESNRGRLLENIVVLVKDKGGDPVRALKTNKLGQFSITTPLPNGTYSIEVGSKGKQFDIIRIELDGSVLKPLRIVEKNNIAA